MSLLDQLLEKCSVKCRYVLHGKDGDLVFEGQAPDGEGLYDGVKGLLYDLENKKCIRHEECTCNVDGSLTLSFSGSASELRFLHKIIKLIPWMLDELSKHG